jgi:hypothetical protein
MAKLRFVVKDDDLNIVDAGFNDWFNVKNKTDSYGVSMRLKGQPHFAHLACRKKDGQIKIVLFKHLNRAIKYIKIIYPDYKNPFVNKESAQC